MKLKPEFRPEPFKPAPLEQPMTSIAELMTHDHRACDHDFARAETLADRSQWEEADQALAAFADALNAHFDAEEQTLFPAFEAATGMTQGPTEVMRGEHRDMREILERLQEALSARDADEFAGEAETLMIMMQQHNMKEENILYPMCDARLGTEQASVCSSLGAALNQENRA
jgi:hemerythrin-like domain-containing protein